MTNTDIASLRNLRHYYAETTIELSAAVELLARVLERLVDRVEKLESVAKSNTKAVD